jgi:GH15 family glucan-1,4-alpha-glucosidase
MLVQSDIALEETASGTLEGRARLAPGARRQVSLAFSMGAPGIVPPTDPAHARAELDATLGWWRALESRVEYQGPFREAVLRSLVTLRLLAFSQSGAVVAAPTTSLPEAIGAARNYDYRYCWLRDASFVLNAFASLGQTDVAAAFFRWLMHATQLTAPKLQTFYTVFGRTNVGERPIKTLEGYRGSAPVLLGNAAESQLQLDAYGSVMTAVAAYCRHGGRVGASEQRRLRRIAEIVVRHWSLPDDGLWEMPGPRVHNTYSKVMCWAALDAYVALCREGHVRADATSFARERDRIRASVMARGWSESRQAFTGAYGQDWLDASLTLMPRFGIIAADDPRMVATFERLDAELGHGAHMRRYADGIDGMEGTEGTFTACGFWAADYLARRGDTDAAEARIGALIGRSNDLMLMAEELDPDTGAQLGNFPQAFSHAGLIGAVMALQEARNRERAAA